MELDKDVLAMRSGNVPYTPEQVQEAQDKLAPAPLEVVQQLFGGITVGANHPVAIGQTREDRTPALSFDADASPSEDSPPDVPTRAEVRSAKASLKFDPDKRYRVKFSSPVQIEPSMTLSPHAIHTLDGAAAEKHKAHIDGSEEVA